MRIAILSDIHGNSLALEAVLNDIQARGGVDGYWVLGDLCAIGYDPIGVLEQLQPLPNKIIIRGNADRYVYSQDLPLPTIDDAINDNNKIKVIREVAGNFGWTRGALDVTGWTSWMQKLPFDHCLTLPDGKEVLLIHSQPHTDEGKGLNPSLTDDELEHILSGVGAQLVCVGHFHLPMRRYFRDMQIINPGSVCNSFTGDQRSYYAMLNATESDFDIQFFGVTYDVETAIQRIKATTNIGNRYNILALSNVFTPSWFPHWDKTSHRPPIEPELTTSSDSG